MNHSTKFVGLDLSKDAIAVAVADGSQAPRYLGGIANTPEAVQRGPIDTSRP